MSKPKKSSRPARKRPKARPQMVQGEALKPISIDSLLSPRTRGILVAFCEAHHGADPAAVIDKAVNAFIVDDLAANEGVGKSYRGEEQD